jgi:CRISPR-associated protein Cas2
MTVIVAYDISDDAVRSRVAYRLLMVGYRIQRSVFEIDGPASDLQAALAAIAALIDEETDSVHVLRICESCGRERVAFGQASIDRSPTHWNV